MCHLFQVLSKTIAHYCRQPCKTWNQKVTSTENEESYLDTTCIDGTGGDDNAWRVDVAVNDQHVMFKVDTGAEVTAISEQTWASLRDTPTLQKATKSLCGPDHMPLHLIGEATIELH
jgi:predicted aspartyl protease